MGQHTWFHKDLNLYEETEKIYEKIDEYDEGVIWLEDDERWDMERRLEEIRKLNDAVYHDVFRTWKREPDGEYCLDVIKSKKECYKWLKDNKDLVSLPEGYEKYLNKFWNEYSNGVIRFG